MFYKTVEVNGLEVFYREAGPADGEVVLLLHGFPSSSHMFRDLIPQLATRYRVLAPDYPGFGNSAMPSLTDFPYTFEAVAEVIDGFTEAVGVSRYVIYMHDYGGPIGFRRAVKHPERIRGLIIQNAVASLSGWAPHALKQVRPFWRNRNAETERPMRDLLTPEMTKFQYSHGATLVDRLSPDGWVYDQAKLDRPGNKSIQLQMLFDYQNNLANYPRWEKYLRTRQPPTLIVWVRTTPFFTLDGVDFFKAQIPNAEVHIFDAGHFALETHAGEIGRLCLTFLARLP